MYTENCPVAIKLPYREFKQTEKGLRSLGNCDLEQAQLLREQALLSINPDEATDTPGFSWNTYVLATVAFLRKDRAAFDVQYEAHRRAREVNAEIAMNLTLLARLSESFDKQYRAAYGKCRPQD